MKVLATIVLVSVAVLAQGVILPSPYPYNNRYNSKILPIKTNPVYYRSSYGSSSAAMSADPTLESEHRSNFIPTTYRQEYQVYTYPYYYQNYKYPYQTYQYTYKFYYPYKTPTPSYPYPYPFHIGSSAPNVGARRIPNYYN